MEAEDNNYNKAVCPSCERFIGAVDVCPYCDADSARPPILRFMRYASVVMAFTGLVFLYFMAKAGDVPGVAVRDLVPSMNFAAVRMSGVVQGKVYAARDGGKLSFVLNDGTGDIRILAYGRTACNIIEQRLVPASGDRVTATGSLSVSAGGEARLYLRSARELIVEAEAGERKVSP